MKRAAIVGLSALLAVATLTTQASTSQGKPPRTRLIIGDRGQEGELGSYCWSHRRPNGGGVGTCADTFSYPLQSEIRVPAGRHAEIRIRGRGEPFDIDLWGWRRVSEREDFGAPQTVGPRRTFNTGLRRIRRDGDLIGWLVLFRIPRREGDLYLELWAKWHRGDAFYGFHLDLR